MRSRQQGQRGDYGQADAECGERAEPCGRVDLGHRHDQQRTAPQRLSRIQAELREVAGSTRLALAGAGASEALAVSIGAELLDGDPVTQAARIVAAH